VLRWQRRKRQLVHAPCDKSVLLSYLRQLNVGRVDGSCADDLCDRDDLPIEFHLGPRLCRRLRLSPACAVDQKSYDPWDSLRIFHGLSIELEDTSTYYDIMGWNSNVVTYYRNMGMSPMPCASTVNQDLSISCVSSDPTYDSNEVVSTINTTTVSVYRGTIGASRTWP
jgi:hypothetical protein